MKDLMIKRICFVCALVLCCVLWTPALAEEEGAARISVLKGPTGMAFAHMMARESDDRVFSVAGAPDEITGQLFGGNIDIAAVPLNLACVLNSKSGGEIRILCLITGGMLYVLENGNTVSGLQDLNGKSILAAGQGAAPEYVFNYILNANGVEADVTWAAEQTEVISLALAGRADIVLLPEPHVSTLLAKNSDFNVCLSLTEEFDKAARADGYENAEMHMSCVVARQEYLDARPDAARELMTELEESIGFALAEPEAAAEEIAAAGIIPSADIALAALPNCALCFISGEEMPERALPMIEVLYNANPRSVGGKMPDETLFAVIP